MAIRPCFHSPQAIRAAPPCAQWLSEALIRKAPYQTVATHYLGLLESVRWSYSLEESGVVLQMLHDFEATKKTDLFHAVKFDILFHLLGERSFGQTVSRLTTVTYAHWQEATQGGRSWPLSGLAQGLAPLGNGAGRLGDQTAA